MMRSSPTTAIIDTAVGAVQAELVTIKNNAKAGISGGGTSGFTTFDQIWEVLRGPCAANRITVYQGGSCGPHGGDRLITRVAKAGEWIESDYPIKAVREGGQGIGAAISFVKRYGLCGMFGIVTSNDAEEKQGYRDARPLKPGAKAKAPAGIAALLESLRTAEFPDDFARIAGVARAAHPTGEGAAAVEQTIGTWFVAAFDGAATLDTLTMLRDLANRVRPRSNDVRTAIQAAGNRLEGGTSR